MKIHYTLLSLLLSSLVAANSFSFFGGSQRILDGDDDGIPGDSPLKHCPGEHKNDILTINYINLKPNPPEPGNPLIVEAQGILSEAVEQGAYVNLQVKYGLIRLVNTKADLCEQIGNVNLECPIKEGETTLEKQIDMPKEIPPGKYTVVADAYTKEGKPITCLTVEITFSM